MAGRIDEIIRNMDPTLNRFMNKERVQILSAVRERTTAPVTTRAKMTMELGHELLRLGSNEQAIAILQVLLSPPPDAGPDWPPADQVRALMAVCLYRLGIAENCMAHPNPSRCLLPVTGEGMHIEKRGGRGAMDMSLKILETLPDDVGSVWILNVAAMQIGAWPDGVPERFRISPAVFASNYDIGLFPNVAIRIGLGVFGHAGGGIMEDFDGDDLLDIMITSMGLRDQMRLYRNEGNGTFRDVTEAAGLYGERGGLNMSDADYDNDGDVDVLVLRGGWAQAGGRFPNALLRNNGDGTFDDVTDEAGVLAFRPTQVGVWGDFDNDGWIDLFVGDLDLYVSRLHGDNYLFRNDGPALFGLLGASRWRFTNVADAAGVTNPQNSFPTWFWDFDNDGWLDIMAAGYRVVSNDGDVGDVAKLYLGKPNRLEISCLYRNNHDGTFTDVAPQMHISHIPLPMGSNFGDLDNDGWPDAYFGTGEPSMRTIIPNRLFQRPVREPRPWPPLGDAAPRGTPHQPPRRRRADQDHRDDTGRSARHLRRRRHRRQLRLQQPPAGNRPRRRHRHRKYRSHLADQRHGPAVQGAGAGSDVPDRRRGRDPDPRRGQAIQALEDVQHAEVIVEGVEVLAAGSGEEGAQLVVGGVQLPAG